jgi:uncharacterized membrane protein
MSKIAFVLVLVLTLLTLAVLAVPAPSGNYLLPARLLLTLALLAFLPGYALQAALFPHPTALSALERVAIAFGLSVAIFAPLALILDSTSLGIRLWPLTISLTALTVICATIAFLQRRRLVREPSRPATIHELTAWWRAQSPARRRGVIGAAVLVLFVSGYAILSLTAPRADERFTEFYLLGEGNVAENYPRQVAVNQPLTLHLGVTNQEGTSQTYAIIARLGEQILGQSAPFTLAAGQSQTLDLTLRLPVIGENQRLDLMLLRADLPQPYRQLTLWLDVTP